MKTDWERLFECLTCENDPMTCNCTDADEDEELPHMEVQISSRTIILEDVIRKAIELTGEAEPRLYIKPDEGIVYYVTEDRAGSFLC